VCGIAGVVRFDGSEASVEDRVAVARMMKLEQHRGPDGEGIHADGPVVLGHRRLAIIDLRPEGRQPMSNETGTVWVTFNGEIYNYGELRTELLAAGHCFVSSSDTEVLVHGYEQWGIEGLTKRLRGMFAFAVYDAECRARGDGSPFFFAARDRLGIKPLYYTLQGHNFLAFASEVKALYQSGLAGGQVNQQALATFLSLGSVSYPGTWLKGVECLPPGHFMIAGPGGVKVFKYWDLSYEGAAADCDLALTLHEAVQRHLVADVPVGVFLSGGVDSGGIAALAARGRSAPIRTLTITFDEQEFDEAEHARTFANRFGTDHHEIRVTPRDFADELPNLLNAADQPTADGVNTYFVSRAARQLGLKVVLSGLGGDELFFGYPHYKPLAGGGGALGAYARSSALMRRTVGYGAALYGRTWGQEKWQRFDYCANRSLHEGMYLLVRGFFPPAQVCSLLGMTSSSLNSTLDQSFESIRVLGENGHVDVNRFHYLEMRRYLHDQLLRDSDVFSMAHSIELRVPLLDDKVVEASCRIPPQDKVSSAMNKPALVNALDDASIREAACRPKRGFTFPFARWMLAQSGELEERALQGRLLDPAGIRHCWQHFRAGRLHWSRAWATVVLGALDCQPN
jgi:asparagine synthase (glutamine-hydrolysing)